MKPGEWAFSLERLTDGFRLHNQGQFPQRPSKGVLWKAFAYFRPSTKVSARPGTRGKSAPAETYAGESADNLCQQKMRRSRT